MHRSCLPNPPIQLLILSGIPYLAFPRLRYLEVRAKLPSSRPVILDRLTCLEALGDTDDSNLELDLRRTSETCPRSWKDHRDMMSLSLRQSLIEAFVVRVRGPQIQYGEASFRAVRRSSLPQRPCDPFATVALDISCTETFPLAPASDSGSTNKDPSIDVDNSRRVEASPPGL